jgi:addiction module RelE/StbE family toxin
MAFKIIWSEPALSDLAGLTSYIAEDNPLAAEKTGSAILGKIANLINHPRIGRMVPEIGSKDIRELIYRPYRIIYHVNGKLETIEILRVWHGARGEPQL